VEDLEVADLRTLRGTGRSHFFSRFLAPKLGGADHFQKGSGYHQERLRGG
jgi:hypothetical protein